jgi:cysteine desulfurase family protein
LDKVAYFDNAATTFPKPEEVYAFTDRFYRECGVNVGRGQYKLAGKAAAMVGETRELLLSLNHCKDKRVVFTHTATEALNIILKGIPLDSGGNVYVSPFEHNAVLRTLHDMVGSVGIHVSMLAFDKENGVYDLERIKYQFADCRPSLVVISHASNVCGILAPISEMFRLAKNFGATTVVDMCQTMGLVDTDLGNPAIDYAVFAGHKTLYAPFGVAGFICPADSELRPLLFGGTGIDSASHAMPESIPERFEAGSLNTMAIAGLNASLRWLQGVGIDAVFEAEQKHHTRLLGLLEQCGNIKIIPSMRGDDSIGVVSCVFDGYSSDSIGRILSEKDIAVRTGLHCAPDAHRLLGTFPGGAVRFSVGYFNTDEDFGMLRDALDYIDENS